MTNLLDECIDYPVFHRAPYQGIVNTIVQLIRTDSSSVIASSRPIQSEERHEKQACRMIRLPKTSPCAASFSTSTWTPADYAKLKYLKTSAPPDSGSKERMATTCRKQPGNLTRNTDSSRLRATYPTASTRFRSREKNH